MTLIDPSKRSRCACAGLRRATRVVTQFYDNHLRPAGLKTTQFLLLATVATNRGISITELADVLELDQTTATRNLEGLKKAGYLTIEKESGDARRKVVELTVQGEEKLREARPFWAKAQTHVEENFGEEKLTALLHELIRITDAVK